MRLEKNFQKATEFLLIARKINPRNSNVFYNFSLLYRDLDEIENAIKSINQAIKLDINNNLYKLLKADLLKDKNKFQESKLILNELYLKNSINDKKDILLMLSTVERLDSRFPESEKILLSLIQDYPNFSNAYLNLSDLYFEQKMIIKAKDILSKGIERNPNEPLLYANLGVVSRSLGNINESTLYHLKALSLNILSSSNS